jgi:hypothetical protein
MIQLIHCKNLCKCHNVYSTTIKGKKCKEKENFKNLKMFCSVKDQQDSTKRQGTGKEKIPANYVSDLEPKIHKEP